MLAGVCIEEEEKAQQDRVCARVHWGGERGAHFSPTVSPPALTSVPTVPRQRGPERGPEGGVRVALCEAIPHTPQAVLGRSVGVRVRACLPKTTTTQHSTSVLARRWALQTDGDVLAQRRQAGGLTISRRHREMDGQCHCGEQNSQRRRAEVEGAHFRPNPGIKLNAFHSEDKPSELSSQGRCRWARAPR